MTDDKARPKLNTGPLLFALLSPYVLIDPVRMQAAMSSNGVPASAEHPEDLYFDINPPPSFLESHVELAKNFINKHAIDNRRVALVTSGGTTVPLENQTVRFIDNFSNGTRGATSAEYFLDAGYAVIFLHRQFSLLPYSRHYSHSTNCFLDFMDISNLTGRVTVGEEYQSQMKRVLNQYRKAKEEDLLLLLPYTTITEYLWCLREFARLMKPIGPNAIFYLAAAVSDFFVPKDRMVEHKIQSSEEYNTSAAQADGEEALPAAHMVDKSLVIDLDPVPKFLKRLVDLWAPGAMIISFKLETDPALLTTKASSALKKYAHHLVIGNLLSTRKWEVVFVSSIEGEKWIRVPPRLRHGSVSGRPDLVGSAQDRARDGEANVNLKQFGEPIVEIESLMIPEVARLHTEFIQRSTDSKT